MIAVLFRLLVAESCKRSLVRCCEDPLDTSYERACREQTFQRLASAQALPRLPNGNSLVIGLGSLAECDTGGRVWSSAAIMCECANWRIDPRSK